MSKRASDPMTYSLIILTVCTVMAIALVAMMVLTDAPKAAVALGGFGPYLVAFAHISTIWRMHNKGYDIPIRFGPPEEKKESSR